MALVMALLFSGIKSAAHTGGPHLRFAHLAPQVGAVDIYINGAAALTNIRLKQTSDYLPLIGTEFTIWAVPAGKSTSESLNKDATVFTFRMGDTGYYTVVLMGDPSANTFELVLLPMDALSTEALANAPTKASGSAGTIIITDAWLQAASHGGNRHSVIAGYMNIVNTAETADALLEAACDAAKRVEVHLAKIENGLPKHEHLPNGLEIAGRSLVEFRADSYQLMLVDVEGEMGIGRVIVCTLKFRSGAEISLQMPALIG